MIDNEDFLQIIYRGSERTNVDYKRSIPWNKKTKFDLTKDILCFANSGGGYIIIGVDDSGKSDKEMFTGVEIGDRETWDITEVNKTASNFSSAPIDLELIPVQDKDKNLAFLVLVIPSHTNLPHICKKTQNDKDGKSILRMGAIYSRTKNKSCEEMSDPNEVAELIRRCTLNDRNKLVKEFSEILAVNPISQQLESYKSKPYHEMDKLSKHANKFISDAIRKLPFWEMICFPEVPLSSHGVEKAKISLCNACRDYGDMGWPFIFYLKSSIFPPQYADNAIFAVANKTSRKEHFFRYWSFNYEKGIFYSKKLTRESEIGKQACFDPDWQINRIAEAIKSIANLFFDLDYSLSNAFVFGLRYSSMNGMRVQSASPYGESRWHAAEAGYAGEIIDIPKRFQLSHLLNNSETLASELLVETIQRIGFDARTSPHYFEGNAKKHLSKFVQECHNS